MQRGDAVAESRRQYLLQLQEGAHRGFVDASDSSACGGSQSERNSNGLIVVEQQRGQGRARSELIAACDSRGRVDRVSETAQAVDVPAQGASRDIKTLRQFGPTPIPLRLEK